MRGVDRYRRDARYQQAVRLLQLLSARDVENIELLVDDLCGLYGDDFLPQLSFLPVRVDGRQPGTSATLPMLEYVVRYTSDEVFGAVLRKIDDPKKIHEFFNEKVLFLMRGQSKIFAAMCREPRLHSKALLLLNHGVIPCDYPSKRPDQTDIGEQNPLLLVMQSQPFNEELLKALVRKGAYLNEPCNPHVGDNQEVIEFIRAQNGLLALALEREKARSFGHFKHAKRDEPGPIVRRYHEHILCEESRVRSWARNIVFAVEKKIMTFGSNITVNVRLPERLGDSAIRDSLMQKIKESGMLPSSDAERKLSVERKIVDGKSTDLVKVSLDSNTLALLQKLAKQSYVFQR